jgi:hypothetical protein
MTVKRADLTPVTPEELRKLNDALIARQGLHLRPGESIVLAARRTAESTQAVVVLATSDESFRLELEAVVLTDDEHKNLGDSDAILDAAVDFVDAMFSEFVLNERTSRFHDDWRVYDFDGYMVRFRGFATNPSADAMADAWLLKHGVSDDEL